MSFVLELTVLPKSSVNKFMIKDNIIKLKITSPPVDGQANKHIIEFLAKQFSCPKTSIELIAGHKSSKKRFVFHKLSQEDGQNLFNKIIGEL